MKLRELGRGRIASVTGRYYAMDRDQRWERTARAWRAWVMGEGPAAPNARAAVEAAYATDKGDEFVEPTIIGGVRPIADGDQIICYNFRADRARQLTAALALAKFAGFERPHFPQAGYVCMTEYDASFALPLAFGPEVLRDTLAEVWGRAGLRNLRVAETEKYAHVTYFLNGGAEQPFPGEERALIPSSKKVATYDLEPAMQAAAIAARAAEAIAAGKFDVVVMNFANPDMVGHTGKMEATVAAVETSDAALGVVIDALARVGGVALITSDHGNAEFMADPATGQPHTAHTTNPVPLILYDPSFTGRLADAGGLADVAPTFLAMLEIAQPPAMTGRDLRELKDRDLNTGVVWMKMVQQRPPSDGTTAMDCGLCAVAMLTDLPYEKILADMPQYKATSDPAWMHYVRRLGFQVHQVDENNPPTGSRLYCGITAVVNGKTIHHALAVDEFGRIFDPSTSAPEPGKVTLKGCVENGTFKIHCCFVVRDRRSL